MEVDGYLQWVSNTFLLYRAGKRCPGEMTRCVPLCGFRMQTLEGDVLAGKEAMNQETSSLMQWMA